MLGFEEGHQLSHGIDHDRRRHILNGARDLFALRKIDGQREDRVVITCFFALRTPIAVEIGGGGSARAPIRGVHRVRVTMQALGGMREKGRPPKWRIDFDLAFRNCSRPDVCR